MTDKRIRTFALVAAICMMCVPLMMSSDLSADEGDGWILMDEGDGNTFWISIADTSGTTVGDRIDSATDSIGRSYSFSSGKITIDGISEVTIGGADSGGTISEPGLTGNKVTTAWNYYVWDDGWKEAAYDPAAAYVSGSMAIGFYPSGTLPTETPEYRSSWTTVRGDAQLSGTQTATVSDEAGNVNYLYESRVKGDYVCSSVLVEGQYVYVGFGGTHAGTVKPTYFCYDRFTGAEIWSFEYPRGAGYETASACIVGDHIYIPATNGRIYKVPLAGPGENYDDVTEVTMPFTTVAVEGSMYASGPASLVYGSGVLYCGASNGMVYCFDLDLNLIWSYQTGGCIYYYPPSIYDDDLFIGSRDGTINILDKRTGAEILVKKIYTVISNGEEGGAVAAVVKIDDTLIFSFSDGQGMGTAAGGIGVYNYDGTDLTVVKEYKDIGLSPNYHQPIVNDDFKGTFFFTSKGMYKVSTSGNLVNMGSPIESPKAAPVLVNGDTIYITEYKMRGTSYQFDLDGNILYSFPMPKGARDYCMTSIIVIDGWLYFGNDGGFYAVNGQMNVVEPPSPGEEGWFAENMWVIAVIVLLASLILLYIMVRRMERNNGSYTRFKEKVSSAFGITPSTTHVRKNKRKLLIVLTIGIVLSVILFMVCLMWGRDGGTYGIAESLSLLISAIQKGGTGLTNNEIIIFSSRFPRILAAFMVGMGLSVAGAIYQAIIRNPLVDPYIMGVSSGAGTAAVAVIAFNFTFFGLFPENSIYLTAIAALVGGIVAFFATMLIAEKSGGSSVNYVLSGVVVGLAFSAVQTLMLSMAGHKVTNALSWLFGSFANVSWTNIWMIIIPAIALSIIPLFWAKELNLVLLGEDEAKQMGLNVRKFNRMMLILASILTAFCVAFVGIIGFVGLVIPHLCRMILGGDHRLVLPASMVLGGVLMMMADFASRMILISQELPVGAITTIVGVPVFAYLLIKRGRMYDG